jgi:hypothetical protein
MIILINGSGGGLGTQVGPSWQPDVAQFLLEMVPHALEQGLDLSDIAPLMTEELFDFEEWEDDPFGDDDL